MYSEFAVENLLFISDIIQWKRGYFGYLKHKYAKYGKMDDDSEDEENDTPTLTQQSSVSKISCNANQLPEPPKITVRRKSHNPTAKVHNRPNDNFATESISPPTINTTTMASSEHIEIESFTPESIDAGNSQLPPATQFAQPIQPAIVNGSQLDYATQPPPLSFDHLKNKNDNTTASTSNSNLSVSSLGISHRKSTISMSEVPHIIAVPIPPRLPKTQQQKLPEKEQRKAKPTQSKHHKQLKKRPSSAGHQSRHRKLFQNFADGRPHTTDSEDEKERGKGKGKFKQFDKDCRNNSDDDATRIIIKRQKSNTSSPQIPQLIQTGTGARQSICGYGSDGTAATKNLLNDPFDLDMDIDIETPVPNDAGVDGDEEDNVDIDVANGMKNGNDNIDWTVALDTFEILFGWYLNISKEIPLCSIMSKKEANSGRRNSNLDSYHLKAIKLFETYVKVGSEFEINISYSTRKDLKKYFISLKKQSNKEQSIHNNAMMQIAPELLKHAKTNSINSKNGKPNSVTVTRNTKLKNKNNSGSTKKAFSIVVTHTNRPKVNSKDQDSDPFNHRRESSDDMMLNYGANIGLDRQNTQKLIIHKRYSELLQSRSFTNLQATLDNGNAKNSNNDSQNNSEQVLPRDIQIPPQKAPPRNINTTRKPLNSADRTTSTPFLSNNESKRVANENRKEKGCGNQSVDISDTDSDFVSESLSCTMVEKESGDDAEYSQTQTQTHTLTQSKTRTETPKSILGYHAATRARHAGKRDSIKILKRMQSRALILSSQDEFTTFKESIVNCEKLLRIFDLACEQIYSIMRRDCLNRFKQTKLYAKYLTLFKPDIINGNIRRQSVDYNMVQMASLYVSKRQQKRLERLNARTDGTKIEQKQGGVVGVGNSGIDNNNTASVYIPQNNKLCANGGSNFDDSGMRIRICLRYYQEAPLRRIKSANKIKVVNGGNSAIVTNVNANVNVKNVIQIGNASLTRENNVNNNTNDINNRKNTNNTRARDANNDDKKIESATTITKVATERIKSPRNVIRHENTVKSGVGQNNKNKTTLKKSKKSNRNVKRDVKVQENVATSKSKSGKPDSPRKRKIGNNIGKKADKLKEGGEFKSAESTPRVKSKLKKKRSSVSDRVKMFEQVNKNIEKHNESLTITKSKSKSKLKNKNKSKSKSKSKNQGKNNEKWMSKTSPMSKSTKSTQSSRIIIDRKKAIDTKSTSTSSNKNKSNEKNNNSNNNHNKNNNKNKENNSKHRLRKVASYSPTSPETQIESDNHIDSKFEFNNHSGSCSTNNSVLSTSDNDDIKVNIFNSPTIRRIKSQNNENINNNNSDNKNSSSVNSPNNKYSNSVVVKPSIERKKSPKLQSANDVNIKIVRKNQVNTANIITDIKRNNNNEKNNKNSNNTNVSPRNNGGNTAVRNVQINRR